MDYSERLRARRHHLNEHPVAGPTATPPAHPADPQVDLRVPERLLALQAQAGNRAVQRVVADGQPGQIPVVQRATGLAANVDGFVQDITGVFQQWGSPEANADTRRTALYGAIKAQLAQLNIPKVDLYSGAVGSGGSVHGTFNPRLWIIDISGKLLDNSQPSPTERAELADTVIHESRHAEQFFRVARLLCAKESDARRKRGEKQNDEAVASLVATSLGMDLRTVKDAQSQATKLSDDETAEAEMWSKSIPHNAAAREQRDRAAAAFLQCLRNLQAFESDLARTRKQPGPAGMPVNYSYFRKRYTELRKRFETTFTQYSQAYMAYYSGLSFEADAWQLGRAAYTASGQKPADPKTKLAALGEPWEKKLTAWQKQLAVPPPRPKRDLSITVPVMQRHAMPAELEQLPGGVEPIA